MTVPCCGPFRALCALGGCATLLALVRWDLPVWNLSEPGAADELRRGAELEANRDSALANLRTRVALSRALAGNEQDARSGRLPLLQAAARLRECCLTDPSFRWDVFRTRFPGSSDEERFCRKAIDYAVGQLNAQPRRARAVQRRLETELNAALRRGPRRPSPPGNEQDARSGASRSFPPPE